MFHAGVLMKLGAFAALRVGILLLPEGAAFHFPWIIVLTLVNVVYGAFIAMTQTDMKYMIGFSSVSHMGLVALGFATLTWDGFVGASLQMVSHGLKTALFFAVVGMIYDQSHTRQIPELGGMMKVMPLAGVAFIIGGLVSMGMPGFSGFIAEFPIFMGAWAQLPPGCHPCCGLHCDHSRLRTARSQRCVLRRDSRKHQRPYARCYALGEAGAWLALPCAGRGGGLPQRYGPNG